MFSPNTAGIMTDPFAGGIVNYLHPNFDKLQLYREPWLDTARVFHERIWGESIMCVFNDATIEIFLADYEGSMKSRI
jgi:hypothetical protein